MESLNDYLFALSSHAVYWSSSDCILFMLNEIFNAPPPPIRQQQQTLQRKETLTLALQGASRDQLTPSNGSQSSLADITSMRLGACREMSHTPKSDYLHSSLSTPTLDTNVMCTPVPCTGI